MAGPRTKRALRRAGLAGLSLLAAGLLFEGVLRFQINRVDNVVAEIGDDLHSVGGDRRRV